MPTYDSFCRAPLVDPAFAALPDSAVHTEGTLETLIRQALDTVALAALSPLDAVLATKLGGYSDMPPMPALASLAERLPEGPSEFMDAVRAGLMIAAAGKNKAAMLQVIDAMRAFASALPSLDENALLAVGADALRISSELYRRSGQRFLLGLMERLRAQLPDVSGMFHSFPFQKPFSPQTVEEAATDEASQYHRRMRLLGTGKLTADALAITAELAMYSGSARDAGASKAGMAALQRYHGMPHGAFAADPYLAGRDPSRGSDLACVCAQLEALHDLLAASGDTGYAERMERIVENALANALQPGGVLRAQAINCFAGADACAAVAARPEDTAALLRALYAVRRSVWMLKNDNDLAMLLPYDGCCLARMDGTPVRVTAAHTAPHTLRLSLEVKQPTEFTLSLQVPGYAQSATVSVNDQKPQSVDCGKLYGIKRMFRTGDTVTLALRCQPFVEAGFHGSASVFYGPYLMAFPLPEAGAAWQYAIDSECAPTLTWDNGKPRVHVDACDAPTWVSRSEGIAPPPQGLRMGEGYELTLLPYADTQGRIAAFPQAAARRA